MSEQGATHERILLIGAGGHGKVVADVLLSAGRPAVGFIDYKPGLIAHGLPLVPHMDPAGCAIIAVGDNWKREQLAEQHRPWATAAVHRTAVIGGDVEIGEGTVVMAGAVVNPGVRIGRHCIINTGSRIDHDCTIEDYSSIGPGTTLGGGVKVGRGTAVGLGSSVVHRIVIGEYTVVGAGALVLKDLPAQVVAYGCPARVVSPRKREDTYL
jgi:sugar O-acyltransferase (sialic acid O-acetyltransferase NeuD family)